ncbi:zf-HC2 domain-containing protein, partial [candidate division TA06 bacterium]|nr:zf-HC2 domain-containing protein [candidate division TA06 bacterium]
MNCKGSESLTLEYFDRTLPADQKKELEDHIGRCESCLKIYNRLSVLLSEKSHLQRFQVPPQFQQKLWSRIQSESTKQEAGTSSIRSAFRIPRVWVPRLSHGFAFLFLA